MKPALPAHLGILQLVRQALYIVTNGKLSRELRTQQQEMSLCHTLICDLIECQLLKLAVALSPRARWGVWPYHPGPDGGVALSPGARWGCGLITWVTMVPCSM